jgi:hypothetical protein
MKYAWIERRKRPVVHGVGDDGMTFCRVENGRPNGVAVALRHADAVPAAGRACLNCAQLSHAFRQDALNRSRAAMLAIINQPEGRM